MITIAMIVVALCALVKVAHGEVRRLRIHEPRALHLLPERSLVDEQPGMPPLPRTLVEAVTYGFARMDGTCTRCGGRWNAAHGDAPHSRWVRSVPRPARADERLD